MLVACRVIGEEPDDLGKARRRLLEYSRFSELQALVESHFGNRASVIKAERTIREVRDACLRLRGQVRGRQATTVAKIDADFERLSLEDRSFEELAVLQDHYGGRLQLIDFEIDEVLRATGEHGSSLPDRLGLPSGAAPTRWRRWRITRVSYWSRRCVDPRLDLATRRAARVIRRTYEGMLSDIALTGSPK